MACAVLGLFQLVEAATLFRDAASRYALFHAAPTCGGALGAACLTLSTGVAICALSLPPRQVFGRQMAWLSLLNASFACLIPISYLFDPGIAYLATLKPLIYPTSSLCFCLINLAILLGPLSPALVRTSFSRQPGAVIIRYLGAWGLATVLLFCLLREAKWIKSGQDTAFFVPTFSVACVAALWHAAAVLNQQQFKQAQALQMAERGVKYCSQRMQTLEAEKLLVAQILRAAQSYSIIATDCTGTITLFNEGAVRMLGYSANEVVGQVSPVIFHSQSEIKQRAGKLGIEPSFALFKRWAESEIGNERTWTYIRKDGTSLIVDLTLTPVMSEAARLIGYVGIARDVTQELQDREDLDAFFNMGQELKCIADIHGCMRRVNPAFSRIVGRSSKDLLHHSFASFVHPEDVYGFTEVLERLPSDSTLAAFENRWRCQDGSYRFIAWHALPCSKSGHLYLCGWDVTEIRARAEQKDAQAQFEKQLIGIVSHDLRNPVGAINLTAAATLRQCLLPNKARKNIERIGRASSRMERMIHDLLDFTQARLGGSLKVIVQDVNVHQLVVEAVDELQLLANCRQLRLNMSGSKRGYVDPDRFVQVIGNLVSNALHYSPLQTRVTVTLKADEGGTQLSVHNAGSPIPAQLQARLFEPLQRNHLGSSNPARSIGLGLYIVSKVMEAHKGNVQVVSSREAGTTFTLYFPPRASGVTS